MMQQPPAAQHPTRWPHPQSSLPRHSGGGGSGLLAALTLLLVAYTNFSLAGLLFLLAFLAWGATAVNADQQRGKRLWAAVSGLSALGLLLQLGIQAAYLVGTPGLGTVAPFFKLLGFPHADSTAGVLLAVVPLLLALLAAAAQVQAARDNGQLEQRRQTEGTELQLLTSEQLRQRHHRHATSLQHGGGLPGAAAALALLAAAIAQPSVLAAPYMLAAAAKVWGWAGTSSSWEGGEYGARSSTALGNRNGNRAQSRALLQTYTAGYLIALYAWQAALHSWGLLQPVAKVLGLFTLTAADGKDWAQLAPAVVQLVALLLLYLALGAANGGPSEWLGSEQGVSPAQEAGWEGSCEHSPLLLSPRSQQSEVRQHHSASPAAHHGLAASWVQLLHLLLFEFVELVCSKPRAVAAILAGTSLLQPSLLGGCMLLLALLGLLSSAAACSLHRLRRPLAACLLAWQLACYGATIAGRVTEVPPVAEAVGIHSFGAAAWFPLLVMLLAATVAAGPVADPHAGGSPLSSSSLVQLHAQQEQLQQQQQMPPHLQPLLLGIGSLRQPFPHGHGRYHGSGAGSPTAPGDSVSMPEAAATDDLSLAALVPWLVAWNLLLRLLYYSGFVALPALLFVVGAAQYDVLHGMYMAGLLLWLLGRTLRFKPSLSAAALDGTKHWLLRNYSSLHLAAAYAAYVGGLPGFHAVFQPEGLQRLLSIVGLWHPSVAAGMAPVLALLLLATLHCHVGEAVHDATEEQYYSDVDGVATWHPALLVHASCMAVAYGPAAIAILGYCLLLVDCDIALLGLGYLLLLAVLLLHQPPRNRWQEPGGSAMAAAPTSDHAPERPQLAMGSSILPRVMQGLVHRIPGIQKVRLESPARRWLPLLLLAAYAACDFVAQAFLPAAAAASAAGWPGLSDDALEFMRTVVGLNHQAQGLQLALCLLRPLLLLAAIAAYRCFYCLGTVHKQLHHQAMSQAMVEAHRLHSQLGWKALGKRLLILHGSKAVAVLVFAAAMQHAGAVGFVLTVGVVVLAPLLGPPRPGTTCKQSLLRIGLQTAGTLAGGWMVAQYALCVPWLQDLLLHLSPKALDWAEWAGLLVLPPPHLDAVGSTAGELERLLRIKCLLLVAVALKMRAFRWQSKLPQDLRVAGRCGAPCPLFWPQSPDYQPPPLDGPLGAGSLPGQHQAGATSLLGSLHRAATALLSRAQHTTQQALRAMDWPAGQAGPAGQPEEGAGAVAPTTTQPLPAGIVPAVETASATEMPPFTAVGSGVSRYVADGRQRQWLLLRFAAQEWLERAWQEWSLDICMLLLLLAAFSAANALSMLYMAAIAAGMALPSRKQQRVWKWAVVPLLAILLLYQYAVMVGPPPIWPLDSLPALARCMVTAILPGLAPDVQEWLGLGLVDPAALWLLYLSYGACVLQMHYTSWVQCAQQHQQQQQQQQQGQSGDQQQLQARSGSGCFSRDGSLDGIESGRAAQTTPLLSQAARSFFPGNPEEGQHTTLQVSVSSPEPGLGAGAGSIAGADASAGGGAAGGDGAGSHISSSEPPRLWQALELSKRRQWGWHDWARYLVYRHYLDFLLVCVVALCTLENDMLHAGYLALALTFFRSRIQLRVRRNRLFWWLPFFNYAVMLMTLIYQAPFQLLLPHPGAGSKACSWAHILGLFRLEHGESLLSLGYRGAMADVLLWAFIRLQSHIFASGTYDRVIVVVQQEEQEEKRRLEEQVASWKQKQAASAVEESRQRTARRQRVERLKAAATGSFAAGVDTVQQLYAFLVPQQRQHAAASPAEAHPTPPTQQAQPSVPHAPSTTGLTEYERELLAADSSSTAEQPLQDQQQKAAAPPAQEPAMNAAEAAVVAAEVAVQQGRRVGSRLRAWLRHGLRRADRNSYLCYTLFCVAFLSDCSLLTLLLPLSAFAYAIVSIKPSGAYWQLVLLYCEFNILSQYAFLVPRQLRCDFISPQLQHSADVLGIHGNPLRALPVFLVYLATLKHHYSLATRHAARQAATAAATSTSASGSSADLEAGNAATPDPDGVTASGHVADLHQSSSRRYLGESLGSSVSSSLQRIGIGMLEWSTSAWEFLLRCCTVSERPPHFLLVTVSAPQTRPSSPSAQAQERQQGLQLQEQLQGILDGCRRTDIAAARERQERQRLRTFGIGGGSTEEEEPPSSASLHDTPLTFEAGPAGPMQQQGSALPSGGIAGSSGGGAAGLLPGRQPLSLAQQPGVKVGSQGDGQAAYPDLSTVGPLQLAFISFVAAPQGAELPAQEQILDQPPGGQGSSPAGDKGGKTNGSQGASSTDFDSRLDSGTETALFEVVSLKSTPENTSGWCNVAGWPLRSLNPARHAAGTLYRYQQTAGGLPLVPQQQAPPGRAQPEVNILAAECHSRQPQDWYAATAALDFLAWLYVVLQYNNVVTSAHSLSELASERDVVPLDFLATVLLLFMVLVAKRVVYTLGSPLGQALLHLGEMIMYTWYCLVLFWSPLTSAAARTHLRILLLLKCGSFTLTALQLRSGFPPRADSGNGMGRHTFWFMRRVSTPRAVAFNVFLALPFVYELRQLLDWALTPTTLTLYDWLKLEEINISLYFVTWNRKMRATKRFGERQPRYVKFLQGTLLFAGLLLLLWVPLLLFSSGAPTYTVPAVVSFNVNATLSAVGTYTPPSPDNSRSLHLRQLAAAPADAAWLAVKAGGPPADGAADFPIFVGGRRRQRQQWLPDDASMPDELATYSAQQFQLLCTAGDADRFWDLTPPAQRELLTALSNGADQTAGGAISLSLTWTIERNLPPPSDHGGPLCQSSLAVPLASASLRQLTAVLNGTVESAQLLRFDASAGGGSEEDQSREQAAAALYPLVWLMRGDACTSRPVRQADVAGGSRTPSGVATWDWASRWAACNASLLPLPEPKAPEVAPKPDPGPELPEMGNWICGSMGSSSTSSGTEVEQRSRIAPLPGNVEASGVGGSSAARWWRLDCWAVNASGMPVEGREAECGATYAGPRLVAVLERVQGGVIGRTLSKYGVAGLYSIVVLSVGRFLRLSLSNMRAKIPFEDLPNTRRLVSLCQDIYIARAEGELALEESLYWSLVNVYRLPSVLFELTRK